VTVCVIIVEALRRGSVGTAADLFVAVVVGDGIVHLWSQVCMHRQGCWRPSEKYEFGRRR